MSSTKVIGGIVLLGAAGGLAWYLLKGKSPPVPPGNGYLNFTIKDQSGADVAQSYIVIDNGSTQHPAPDLIQLSAGSHSITAKANNYHDLTKTVTIQADKSTNLDFVLVRSTVPTGFFEFSVNDSLSLTPITGGYIVVDDGPTQFPAPDNIELTEGMHVVVGFAPNHVPSDPILLFITAGEQSGYDFLLDEDIAANRYGAF